MLKSTRLLLPKCRRMATSTTLPILHAVKMERNDHIVTIALHRPEKFNAVDMPMWKEIAQAFEWVALQPDIRVAILNGGESPHFCAGIDLSILQSMGLTSVEKECSGRKRWELFQTIQQCQQYFQMVANCPVPVLAASHGSCIGLGVDLLAATDCRYSTKDASFSIREVQMAITADIGTLQRLSHAGIPQGKLRELAFTGRNVGAEEALEMGLINTVFEDISAMEKGVYSIAQTIASHSPLAVMGTKKTLDFAESHSIDEGLEQVALWNASMLISDDLSAVMTATREKKRPVFEDVPKL